ncbi:MAG: YtxH domain-containing protein [Vicinamibacterales bacterium]|nr:YtxH domain-containing protein [Vicinamibacterales bacterium]
MDDRARVLLSACLGALIGGVAGYLFLTEDGRRVRERLEPGMDDLLREMRHLRSAAEKARMAAAEGLLTVSDLRRSVSRAAEQSSGVRPPVAY